ncbi:hypothetical protein EXIGLDRAFT_634221 [Exidia glandulosa HHB12029]|uniref:PQ-loop-domain-containing protein n=1 Tax=Exidia glandulosa HHB12029 TaxID=1314781 RepID=A0A166MQY8_EXIGL|nr:hypothetical protein EXIGLDRAFT_634221 [Exidia glandulosa HHB12029]
MGRVNPVAANVLGTLGAVLWSIQIIPQIIHSHRAKSTAGLSTWLMLCWTVAGLPLGTYNVVQNFNIPLIIQPHMFTVLCAVAWAQCLHFSYVRWIRGTTAVAPIDAARRTSQNGKRYGPGLPSAL